MQYSREVEAMIEARETAPMMHDIVRGFLQKFGSEEVEYPEIWSWVSDSLRVQRQLSSNARDNLTHECCRLILDRIKRFRHGRHRDLQ